MFLEDLLQTFVKWHVILICGSVFSSNLLARQGQGLYGLSCVQIYGYLCTQSLVWCLLVPSRCSINTSQDIFFLSESKFTEALERADTDEGTEKLRKEKSMSIVFIWGLGIF